MWTRGEISHDLRRQLPDADRGVLAGRDDPPAVGQKTHRRRGSFVPLQLVQLVSALDIPHMDDAVGASGEGQAAVRRKSDAGRRGTVVRYSSDQFASRQIPETEDLLIAPGQKARTVR